MTERRADDATRDVMAWLKCEYMQDCVGEEFSGVISAVTGFGVFVELEEVYVEGLIHISALPGDYYHYDAALQRLYGERSGKSFRLGDRVQVQVARVDLDDRKIDFDLVKKLDAADKQAVGSAEPGSEAEAKPKRLSKRELLRTGKIAMAELESRQGRKPSGGRRSDKPGAGRSEPERTGSARPKRSSPRKDAESEKPWGGSADRKASAKPARKRSPEPKADRGSRQKLEAKPGNPGGARLSESELEVIRLSRKPSKGLSNRAKKRKLKKLRGKTSR
jgi:ribonuclease R